MKQKIESLLLVLFCTVGFLFAQQQQAEASWLGRVWKSVGEQAAENQKRAEANRWVKVSSNQYYDIYVDTTSIQHGGEAQDRWVYATLKFVYTPLGSQWLGETSKGLLKPNVVTHSYASYEYWVRGYRRTGIIPLTYYDVHNNLIIKDEELENIQKLQDYATSTSLWHITNGYYAYIPDSTQEKIKDILFRAQGWNY